MVPDEVWNSLPPDPEIEALEQERRALKGDQYRVQGTPNEHAIKCLTARISSKRATRKKMVKTQYRLYYFHNHPTRDLQRQANGEPPVRDNKPPRDLQLSDRAILAGLLCNQPDDLSFEQLHQRRVDVGTSMVRLGRLQERIRPEISGFLGAFATTTRSRAEASSASPSPPPSTTPLSYTVEHPSPFYSDDSLLRTRTPSPALTNSSISSIDDDHSRGFEAYASPYSPSPPLPTPSPPLQQVPSYPTLQPPQYAYYHPIPQQGLPSQPTTPPTFSREIHSMRPIHYPLPTPAFPSIQAPVPLPRTPPLSLAHPPTRAARGRVSPVSLIPESLFPTPSASFTSILPLLTLIPMFSLTYSIIFSRRCTW